MIWFILSLPLAFGVGLIFMEWTEMSSISHGILASIGGIIVLTTILIGYCYSLKELSFKEKEALRPSRLKVYNEIRDFLHFCTCYWTHYRQGMVKGTNDLMNKIDSFKNSIKFEGPLNMPDVENNVKEVIKNAWKLQRFIDRLSGANLRPPNQNYYSIEDNIHALNDWFAQQEKGIEKLFEPYLITLHNKSLS